MSSASSLTALSLSFALLAGTACAAHADLSASALADSASPSVVSDNESSPLPLDQQSGAAGVLGKSPAPTATPVPTATSVPCSGCPHMFVETVNVNAWYNSSTQTLAAGCYVAVKDEAGNWVDDALVTIQWGGQLSGTATALTTLTGEGGYAEAYFFKSTGGRCRTGDTKVSSCTVTNVFKTGWAYSPAQDLQVSDSDNHCN